jgi:glycosyltransferase involved in cell wall biosynthesis
MRSLPDAHLVIVGDALFTEDDRRYREELRRMADEEGLKGRIHFLGFRSDVVPLLQAMDVVLHCSVAPEPFGRVIVEAMLAGTPVVATRGGGVEEIVADGRTGLLVPPDDPAALAAAVERYMENRGLAERLAGAALDHARETFSLEKTVDRLRQLLQKSLW